MDDRQMIYDNLYEGVVKLKPLGFDYIDIDEIILILDDMKQAGATHIEFEYEVSDYSLESAQLVAIKSRLESDEEYNKRFAYEERQKIAKEERKKQEVRSEINLLKRLKAKYPNE